MVIADWCEIRLCTVVLVKYELELVQGLVCLVVKMGQTVWHLCLGHSLAYTHQVVTRSPQPNTGTSVTPIPVRNKIKANTCMDKRRIELSNEIVYKCQICLSDRK